MQKFTGVVRRRLKGIVVVAGVLCTLLVGSLAWSYYSSQHETAGQARLSQVIAGYHRAAGERSNREGFERIIVDAQKIKSDYGSSRVAQLAQYYMAMSEESLGHTDRATEHLQDLIAEGDPMMKSLAQFALGTLYKNHGDTERAMDMFRQLEESGAYSKHHTQAGTHPKAHSPSGAGPSF